MTGVLLAAALAYAAQGIKVFPVKPRDKTPLTEHGHKDATTDAATIRAWWTRWLDANIGAPTGANGWTVLDIDTDSPEKAFEIARRFGLADVIAPLVRTGKGRQLYFQAIPGLGPSVRVTGEPVDVRSGESYVLLPPSVHPNGREYRWSVPLAAPLPEMPSATRERLTSKVAVRPRANASLDGPKIAEGHRNDELTRVAGGLRRYGCDEETIFHHLSKVNATRCDPPLQDDEIGRIARSISHYPSESLSRVVESSGETPGPEIAGPQLFADIKEVLRAHYSMEEPWHYTIAALFILQSRVTLSLPVVFYLFFGGAMGSGKTNALGLIAKLTNGIPFENVSIAALARSMEKGRTVCIDEYDVSRGREVDEPRDALVRQGYKRDAAPFVRWDPVRKAKEEVPTFGPKVLTFRKDVDEALQSRGFLIPTFKAKGDAAFEYVLNNLWTHLGGLPDRLDEWGETTTRSFSGSDLEAIARSPEFRLKVEAVLKELGANRAAEIVTVALLVAEMAGLDVLADLRDANALREIASEASASEDREELLEVLEALTRAEIVSKKEELFGEVKIVRVRQKDVFDEFNRRKRERGEKPLGRKSFVSVRREAGIGEAWIRNYHGSYVWGLPVDWVRTSLTRESESPLVTPEPTTETLAPKLTSAKNLMAISDRVKMRLLSNRGESDSWIARDAILAFQLPEDSAPDLEALVASMRKGMDP